MPGRMVGYVEWVRTGYGFLRDTDGVRRFFPAAAVVPRDAFDKLTTGDRVTFFPVEHKRKGPRAEVLKPWPETAGSDAP